MRKFIGVLMAAVGLWAAPAAHAQIPVTDVASIAKAVEQLTAWKKQYDQMTQQIGVQKSQLESLTGTRNLGQIVDNMGVNATVPQEIADQWRALTRHEQLVSAALTRTKAALSATQTRADQVRALMAAINSTNDPKAIAELQGRIQAENALVATDMQRIQLMQMQQSQNQQRIEEDFREVVRQNRAKPLATW